jgi:hypothetical protein
VLLPDSERQSFGSFLELAVDSWTSLVLLDCGFSVVELAEQKSPSLVVLAESDRV